MLATWHTIHAQQSLQIVNQVQKSVHSNSRPFSHPPAVFLSFPKSNIFRIFSFLGKHCRACKITYSPVALSILQFKTGASASRRIEEEKRDRLFMSLLFPRHDSHELPRRVTTAQRILIRRARVETGKLHGGSRRVTSHLDKRLSC